MLETPARLLRLLSLLQGRRDWPAAELADRLEVTTRTIRKDVDRLRTLGYPVEATRGPIGGYRLGAGGSLPPLLLDDEEAVAVAVALRTSAGAPLAGIEESSLRAMAKLERVLPARLRRRVAAFRELVHVPPTFGGSPVNAGLLAALASATHDHDRIRFWYDDRTGNRTARTAEPHRLVNWNRRWYLAAWDLDRADWRTFRVDRIELRLPVGPRFEPRQFPEQDVGAYIARTVASAGWRYQASVTVHAPAAVVEARINPTVGTVRPVDDDTCLLETGADSLETIAIYLSLLRVDFSVTEPEELVDHISELALRYRRAVAGPRGGIHDSSP